jgi:hypothetical protein
MKRALVLICVVALAACSAVGASPSAGGGVATPGSSQSGGPPPSTPADSIPVSPPPSAAETPTPSQDITEWTDPYRDFPAKACPPELPAPEEPEAAVVSPVFHEPTKFTVPEGVVVAQGLDPVVSSGSYVNDQGEIFQIDVIGARDAVNEYVNGVEGPGGHPGVQVCLDHQFQADDRIPGEDGRSEPEGAPPTEPFGTYKDDLVVAFGLIGVARDAADAERLGALLKNSSPGDWQGILKELGADPGTIDRDDDDNVVDFIFDPWIAKDARHNYLPLKATSIWFRVVVASGAKVRAGACRTVSYTFDQFYLGSPDPSYDVASDAQSTQSWYAGAVRGRTAGQYAVSGRSGYSGWSAKLDDPAPKNITVCYP